MVYINMNYLKTSIDNPPVVHERNYGLDLYKVLCMFFVIAFHFSDHGNINIDCTQPITTNWNILAISRIFGGICNCAYILISGYFLYKKQFNLKTVVRLWLEVWFYSVVIGIICYLIGTTPFTIKNFIEMIFPFTFNQYWFFSTYIVVYLFFPYLNKLVDSLTQKQHKGLIITGLFFTSFMPTFAKADWLNSSNSIPLFIILYFIGAYINKFSIKLSKKQSIILPILLLSAEICSIYAMRLVYSLSGHDKITYFIWGSNKFLVVVTSVALFLTFKDMQIKTNKIIPFLSSSVFGVYLFHIGRFNVFLFKYLFDNSITYNTNLLFPQLLIAMCTIFVSGILFDKIRIILFEKNILKLIDRPLTFLNSYIEKYY